MQAQNTGHEPLLKTKNNPADGSSRYDIIHHGAINGVTGSCHELRVSEDEAILIDCGLFQGQEAEVATAHHPHEQDGNPLISENIPFATAHIKALIVSHVHIDHVGRIPHLLAAGFKGPIYCSEPSAKLLPLVLEDAVKVGFTRNKTLIAGFINTLTERIVPITYGKWQQASPNIKIKFKPAGHILGSAYITCKVSNVGGHPVPESFKVKLKTSVRALLSVKAPKPTTKTIIFSGDLGAPHSPLLKAPASPWHCDTLVMESTYGDKNHQNRKNRRQQLKQIIEKALTNQGTVIIPAFSIGRTQELLYELEQIIHQQRKGVLVRNKLQNAASQMVQEQPPVLPSWQDLEIIIDSTLAAKFTQTYSQLKPYWDKEARRKLKQGRHPLSFDNILTIGSHKDHINTVQYLAKTHRPAIVIAASGMCNGGRVMNYLKAMLHDKRHDVLFVGYQARGTIGRDIQKYGPRQGHVNIDGQKISINAGVYTISGYSAHAGQSDLLKFVKRMWFKPKEIRLIHGDDAAKSALQQKLKNKYPTINTWIP